MPEVPDLEAIRKFINRTVAGQTIERVDTFIPVVIRVPREEFVRLMTGDTLGEVHRHGKFLLFTIASGRKRSQMSNEEVGALYQAVGDVMRWAEPLAWEKMGESLAYKEWRDHLRVHRRGGEACPRCGNTISEITGGGAGQRVTSFCRQCQLEVPRGL